MKIKKIFNRFRQEIVKIPVFFKKAQEILVVELGARPKFINLSLKTGVSVTALKAGDLPAGKNDTLTELLKDFLQQNRIRHKNAILNPAAGEISLKRLVVPAMGRPELAEAIKWQIKDELPYEIDKAVIDFSVIGTTETSDGAKATEVMCVFASEEKIKEQVMVLKQAGLECLGVNISAFGYGRLVQDYYKGAPDESIAILDLGEEKSFIAFYKAGKIDFYREFPLAMKKFKESLSGTLATDKGMINLTPEEIDDILFKRGIPTEGNEAYKDKAAVPEILSMVRAALERLSSEIKRSFAYYESSLQQGAKIKSLLLANLACRIPYLGSFLAKEIPVDFQCFPLEEKVKLASSIDPFLARENAGNIGIALDYGRGVNLLPREFRSEKIEAVQKVSLRWIAFGAFLFLAVSFLFGQANIAAQKRRLDSAMFELKVLAEVQQAKLKFDTLNNFSGEIKSRNVLLTDLMKKLSLIIPQDIFFSDLSLDFTLKSGYIIGSAKIGEDRALTEMVSQMNSSGFFLDACIDMLEKGDSERGEVNNFKIVFRLP